MDIVLASRNRKKIAEIEAILSKVTSDFRLLSLDDIGFTGEIEENGTTFEENAMIKASVPAKLGYYGIADDSGLAVDHLGGAPGVYSARYAGDHGNDALNNEKLLRELADVPDEKRTARFVSVIAFASPDGKNDFTVRGECEGKILRELHGDGGFGYDPLFCYEPLGRTFAELTSAEKNGISHRGAALKLFADEFSARFPNTNK